MSRWDEYSIAGEAAIAVTIARTGLAESFPYTPCIGSPVMSDLSHARSWHWVVDGALGVIFGGICGGIVAVNVVIWAGPDAGYESSLLDVFRHNPLTGIVATVFLLGGPIVGVWTARKLRHQRSST